MSEKTGSKNPTLAMFSNETDSGKHAVATQASGYAGAGFDVVYAKGLLPPPPIGDVTPYVQELLTSNDGGPPDAIVCLLSIDCLEIWTQLKANNYEGTFQSPLYSDLLVKALEGSVASVQYQPFGRGHAGAAADGRGHPRVQGRRRDQLGCGGVVLRGRHADHLAEAAEEAEASRSPARTSRAVAAKTTFEVKGLFGPTKYPNSNVRPTPACTAIVQANGTTWETVEPYVCSTKTFKVQQKFLDTA